MIVVVAICLFHVLDLVDFFLDLLLDELNLLTCPKVEKHEVERNLMFH